MPKRIAIVDQRPDLLTFLKERISEWGYEVIAVLTEEEAETLSPQPNLILVDFEEFNVDLAETLQVIEESLGSRPSSSS